MIVHACYSRALPPINVLQSDEEKEMGAMFKWHTPDRSHTEMALRRQHAREARLHARTVLSNPSLVDAGSGIEGGSDDPFGDLGGSWGFVSTGGPRVPYALLNRSSHGHLCLSFCCATCNLSWCLLASTSVA